MKKAVAVVLAVMMVLVLSVSAFAARGPLTLEEAKQAALEYAGVKASEATFTKAHRDFDDGREVYEIEFYANGTEYEIDVDANQFDVVVAGAEWIASDLRQMLTTEHQLFYANLLHEEVSKGEESVLLNDLLDMSSAKYYDLFRRALQRMSEILKVL